MEGFSAYLKDIGKYPLLNKNQEILLARQVQAWVNGVNLSPREQKRGERAYHKLINCNLRLVVSIAKRYTNKCKRAELFDLVQEGNMGLAHGIKKFDPERGYALSTYVYWWIRQSITRYLSTYDRVIRLPSHAVELLGKLRGWTPVFENVHGRKPTIEECAYEKGNVIGGLETLADDSFHKCFHAGTTADGDNTLACGGRVLSITARGDTLKNAQERAYLELDKVDWEGGFYRRDIGWRAL